MIEYIDVKHLKNYHRNPRKITAEAMARLCENMSGDPEFMEMRPLLCYKDPDGSYIVYAGNQRLRAAKKLNIKKLPCIVDKEVDQELIRKRIVLDNKSSGEWDYDILSADYDAEELFNLGFTEDELFGKDDITKDPVPPKMKVTISFDDQDQMDVLVPMLEDFCHEHDIKISIGK